MDKWEAIVAIILAICFTLIFLAILIVPIFL